MSSTIPESQSSLSKYQIIQVQATVFHVQMWKANVSKMGTLCEWQESVSQVSDSVVKCLSCGKDY